MKLGLLLRCQNHRSQIPHSLIQFGKLVSKKMKLRRHTRKNKDMLSDFPDCILLHILSFLNAKEAVQTCILSTRWKHLWKRLPTLTLSWNHFTTLEGFTEFVKQILSLRDDSMAVNTLDFEQYYSVVVEPFRFEEIVPVEPRLFERIVRYAISHNVNHLHLSCRFLLRCIPPFLFSCPSLPFLFSCPSLTSLDLEFPKFNRQRFPNSLNFPALTCLKLCRFSFHTKNDDEVCVEPFSTVSDVETLCISNTTLLNLSIHLGYVGIGYSKLELAAPNLCTFAFAYSFPEKLCGSSLSSIKQVSIDSYEYKYPMATRNSFGSTQLVDKDD